MTFEIIRWLTDILERLEESLENTLQMGKTACENTKAESDIEVSRKASQWCIEGNVRNQIGEQGGEEDQEWYSLDYAQSCQ